MISTAKDNKINTLDEDVNSSKTGKGQRGNNSGSAMASIANKMNVGVVKGSNKSHQSSDSSGGSSLYEADNLDDDDLMFHQSDESGTVDEVGESLLQTTIITAAGSQLPVLARATVAVNPMLFIIAVAVVVAVVMNWMTSPMNPIQMKRAKVMKIEMNSRK